MEIFHGGYDLNFDHLPLNFAGKSPNEPILSFFALKRFKTCHDDNMSSYSDRGALSRHFEHAGVRVRAIEAKSEASVK